MAMFVAILVFGAALTMAMLAMYATVKPELARIGDLLRHGPVSTVASATQATVRTAVRDVRVARVRPVSPLRAAA